MKLGSGLNDSIGVEVHGLEDLLAYFDSLPEKMQQGFVTKTMKLAGELVSTRAKRDCPVDTGKLQSSITARQVNKNRINDVHVGSNVKYAGYVEYGHGKRVADDTAESGNKKGSRGGVRSTSKGKYRWVAAQPFLRTALNDLAPAIEKLMEDELEKFCDRENSDL